jgi:hypothetical protein
MSTGTISEAPSYPPRIIDLPPASPVPRRQPSLTDDDKLHRGLTKLILDRQIELGTRRDFDVPDNALRAETCCQGIMQPARITGGVFAPVVDVDGRHSAGE